MRAGRADRARTALSCLAQDDRWPTLARIAGDQGVYSLISLPLPASPFPAALDLYGRASGVFTSAQAMAVAGVITRATSILLTDDGASPLEGLSAARTRQAMSERTLIFRAQERLTAREGLSVHAAYRTLAIRSATEASPLRDVAQQVLDCADTGWSGTASGMGEGAPMTAQSQDSIRRQLQAELLTSGLTYHELWWRHVAVGGDASPLELEMYVLGLLALDPHQHDVMPKPSTSISWTAATAIPWSIARRSSRTSKCDCCGGRPTGRRPCVPPVPASGARVDHGGFKGRSQHVSWLE